MPLNMPLNMHCHLFRRQDLEHALALSCHPGAILTHDAITSVRSEGELIFNASY